jgi:long-chain acyl-CoA synthetase
MYAALLHAKSATADDFRSLKYVISGAEPLPESTFDGYRERFNVTINEGYGLTETSPVSNWCRPGEYRRKSVGMPLPRVDQIIVSADEKRLGANQDGEIRMKGPNVMKGYFKLPEQTAAVFDANGYFRTGDMGRFDDDGFLYITGRIKEQYKLENGKYVVPSPLEEELKLSPYIANVMIHGANKPYNVALVVPDKAALTKWAGESGVTLGDDIEKSEDVKKLIEEELKKHSESFKGFERPVKFALTFEDFTTDNGMLTPTLKLKRRNVLAKYEPALDALYS